MLEPAEHAPAPSCRELFLIFSKIGLTSFGGGLSGWMLREFVQVRRLLGEEEFLTGLALAQAFPGVNVVNLSIWIGYRLRGSRGALISVLGIIVPAGILLIVISVGFAALSGYPTTNLVLEGVAAAAVGLSLSMGITAARRAARGGVPILVMLAAFIAVGVFQLSLPLVVLLLGPISIGLAYAGHSRA